ncbi:MAG TPA: DUF1559 domain-containing protein, partial [Pirellulaceae bacterium]|nr:DUF1559 domain-containing protein [Pirellulaceae bacterium]
WIVHILPFIEQKNIYDLYRFDLPYNDTTNGTLGNTVIQTLYCPSGPDPQKYLDGNTNTASNPTTHYYGIMGPGGPADNFQIVVSGVTYQYRYGSAASNGSWSYHGILSHFINNPGSTSISANRVVRMADVLDGTANTLMLGEISKTLPILNRSTGTTQANQYRTWIRGNNGGSGATKNVRYPINSTFYTSNNFNEISFGSDHAGAGALFANADASVRFIRENVDLTTYIMFSSMNGNESVLLP